MHELNVRDQSQSVQQYPENLRFPVIEQLIQTNEVDQILKEISVLRGMMGKYKSPFCDPDLSHRIETADLGLSETVRLLEKLMELSGKCKARLF